MSIIKLQAQILARKCDISNWFSGGVVGWTAGRTGRRTYDQVTTKIFLPMVVVVENIFRGILKRLLVTTNQSRAVIISHMLSPRQKYLRTFFVNAHYLM